MPLQLKPPRPGKSPYWSVRGTHLGVYIDRSTKTPEKAQARTILKRWREEIERGALAGPGTDTFLDAVVGYIKSGGDARFLGSYDEETGRWSGLSGEIGHLPVETIDQGAIDHIAL